MTVELAVVVIARNEESRIRACLDACMSAIQRAKEQGLVRTAEIVLADSASTDRTVEIAREFPITIVQLMEDWPLSAAAGRFVGLRNSESDLVLFVDGDYVLFDGWLPEAIRTLRTHSDIAAVCGRDVEEATGNSKLMEFSKRSTEGLVGEPEAIPIGLYRRAAILSVGGLNPFLRGGEDRDLAQRLRARGYRLARTEDMMGVHHWSDSGPLDFVTYFRSVLAWSMGDGQTLRARLGTVHIRRASRRRYANVRYLFNYLVSLLLGGAIVGNALLLFGVANVLIVSVDLLLLFALFLLRRIRRWTWRDLAFQLHVVPYSVVRHGGFLLGFLVAAKDPSRYPTGERVVQRFRGIEA